MLVPHRPFTASSISLALLPDAQMMKMCTNLASYRAFQSASSCTAKLAVEVHITYRVVVTRDAGLRRGPPRKWVFAQQR